MLGSCRELGDIDISMIHDKNGVLVQNYSLVLKSLVLLVETVLGGPGSHRTKTTVGLIGAAEQW